MNRRFLIAPVLLLSVAAIVVGCGGGGSQPSAQPTVPATTTSTGSGSTSQESGALSGEEPQAAAGDVPDNQVFLTFRNAAEGYSIKYPEGWARRGSPARVTFQDKDNLVRIDVAKGSSTDVAAATAELDLLKEQMKPQSLRFDPPTQMTVGGKPVVKVVYSTQSAPNPVTGKRVNLIVDRYYVPGESKHAVIDLGTPEGVDNVDAFRLIIESFQWK